MTVRFLDTGVAQIIIAVYLLSLLSIIANGSLLYAIAATPALKHGVLILYIAAATFGIASILCLRRKR